MCTKSHWQMYDYHQNNSNIKQTQEGWEKKRREVHKQKIKWLKQVREKRNEEGDFCLRYRSVINDLIVYFISR